MNCPQCYYQVRTKSYWQATGLSGVVCLNCETSLRPTYWRSVSLYLLSFGLGYGMEFLLEMVGFGRWIAYLGFLGMLFLSYLTFATPILRLQIKEDDASVPHPPNH
jgi:hypothetical protein